MDYGTGRLLELCRVAGAGRRFRHGRHRYAAHPHGARGERAGTRRTAVMVVRDGVNGLLVPVHDAAALVAALGKLIGDAALRRRMGEQSRMRAETEFGLETVIAQTLAVYREACA